MEQTSLAVHHQSDLSTELDDQAATLASLQEDLASVRQERDSAAQQASTPSSPIS